MNKLLISLVISVFPLNTLAYQIEKAVIQSSKQTNSKGLGETIQSGYNLAYLHDEYPGYLNPSWMSFIPDETKISEISIPGTHNSLSRQLDEITQTQTLDIKSQLDAGIRFFDVRFKYLNDKLIGFNGDTQQDTNFDTFLETINDFLTAYQSETVLIRVKNEAGAAIEQDDFWERFKVVVDKYESNFFIPNNEDYLLGEARGKFVFIRDFNAKSRIGIHQGSFFIQDEYDFKDNWDLYDKYKDIQLHFDYFQNQSNIISLNYLSGSEGSYPYFVASGKSSQGSHSPQLMTGTATSNQDTWPEFPRRSCVAELCNIYFMGTNELVANWISTEGYNKKLGIVIADFPGAKLINSIISNNSRLIETASDKSKANDDSSNNLAAPLIIYEHWNHEGNSLAINQDMPSLDDFDDTLSSFKIQPGYTVKFYMQENYEGSIYTRTSDSEDNKFAADFNESISSIKIIKNE